MTLFNFLLLNLFAFVCVFQFALDGQSIVGKGGDATDARDYTSQCPCLHDILKSMQ